MKLKADAMAAYGGKCVCCGETEVEFLTLDHVEGGGNEKRSTLKEFGLLIGKSQTGVTFYQYLKNDGWSNEEGLQILCANCNGAKRGLPESPHKLE